MPDRRIELRAEVELEVHYRTAQEFLGAYSRNISGGGVFVRSQQPLPLNQKVLVRFTLPGITHRFEVHGVVVWASPASTRSSFPSGMGIKFMDVPAEDAKLLEGFVKQTKVVTPAPGQKS